jgi:hypothetical protein
VSIDNLFGATPIIVGEDADNEERWEQLNEKLWTEKKNNNELDGMYIRFKKVTIYVINFRTIVEPKSFYPRLKHF